jgi:hypothetical protein
MTIDALAPTRERIKRTAGWDKPEKSRTAKRPAWRALDVFDRMWKAAEIAKHEWEASQKFARHYQGSLGVDVSMGEGRPAHAIAPDAGEYPRSYHAGKMAAVRAALTPRQYGALVFLVEHGDDLSEIGWRFCAFRNRPQARAAGMVLVQEALALAALHYGLKTPHPPNRYG